MRAMIFAAGLGTRLRPLTDHMPKALVPVGGVPLLHRLLTKLYAAGYTHVVINIHHHAAQIIDFLAAHDYGMHIDISDESDMLLDTGGGLRHAAQIFTGVVVSERPTSRYLLFDNNNRLAGWHNISTGATRPPGIDTTALRPYAFAGIHLVSPRIFTLMAHYPDKFSIIDFYLEAMHNETIAAYLPDNFAMLDVGKVDTLAAANDFVTQYHL